MLCPERRGVPFGLRFGGVCERRRLNYSWRSIHTIHIYRSDSRNGRAKGRRISASYKSVGSQGNSGIK